MNSFNEFYSNIFQGNTERYIVLLGITPEGKKNTTQPEGLINFEKHLDPKGKPCGLSPVQYTNEGKAVCRWIGIDRDEEVEAKKACQPVWAIDNLIFPFKSTSGRWHYYKFYDEPIDVLVAQQEKDNLVKLFNSFGWTIDVNKCLPTSFNLEKKTPGNHLYLPRFYDRTKCYSPRGEELTKEQFQFRYNWRKHPLISASVGLTPGVTPGRQQFLFYIALYLRHTGQSSTSLLDEINKNFNEPVGPKDLEHAKEQSYKYELEHLVKNYSSYTEKLSGFALPVSEALQEVMEEPGNEKILKGYTPPENPGVELEFHKKIVFCKKENVYWDLSTWDEYKEKAIDQTFQHLFKQKPSLIYSKNPDKLIVESTVFRPDVYNPTDPFLKEGNKLYLNDYKPEGIEPLGPDQCPDYDYFISLFMKLVSHLNNGTQEYIDWLLDFLATTVQQPGRKIRHIPFYASKVKRFGKGTLFNTMKKIHGKNHAILINTSNALDRGKTFLHRKTLVLVDEIFLKGNYQQLQLLMNQFKHLATEEEHNVRTLYQDYRTIYTTTNFLFYSNFPDALSFDDKEGRYFFIECLGGRLEDSFYSDYWDALDPKDKTGSELAHCVKHFLLNRKIRTYQDLTPQEKADNVKVFDPDGTALLTEYFYEACKRSGTESKRLCRQLIKEKDTPFANDIIAIGEIHKYLVKEYNLKENINYLADALTDLDCIRLGECKHKQSDKHPTLWIIRNKDRYISFTNGQIADNYWLPLDLEKYELEQNDKLRIKSNLKQLETLPDDEVPF